MQGARFCTRKPFPAHPRVQGARFCTREPFPGPPRVQGARFCTREPFPAPPRVQGGPFCPRRALSDPSRVQQSLSCTREHSPGQQDPQTLPKNLSGIRTSSRIPAIEGLFQAQGGRMRDWRRRARGVQASQSRTGRRPTVRKRR